MSRDEILTILRFCEIQRTTKGASLADINSPSGPRSHRPSGRRVLQKKKRHCFLIARSRTCRLVDKLWRIPHTFVYLRDTGGMLHDVCGGFSADCFQRLARLVRKITLSNNKAASLICWKCEVVFIGQVSRPALLQRFAARDSHHAKDRQSYTRITRVVSLQLSYLLWCNTSSSSFLGDLLVACLDLHAMLHNDDIAVLLYKADPGLYS